MSAEKLREYLLTRGIPYEIHDHPLAYEMSQVAEAEHVSGRAMAKPVIVLADDRFVMAVVPGHARIDLEKIRNVVGCRSIRMATESEFAPAFEDCEPGAEPPVGPLYGMHTIVDASLTSPTVTFRSGSHTQTITMDRDAYVMAAGAAVVDIAAG
jgi:Ala-tRNA(Pro) deacylase